MKNVVIASLGALLVLVLATKGYPDQGTAAVQASGDITLKFGMMQETEFEVRDNYDLDNGLTDGCTRAAITGNDCSGTNTDSTDGFVEQETRLIVEGSQGDIWTARVALESEEFWEAERFTVGIERAWADIKLYDTPVHVRAGLLGVEELDPFDLVWYGDEKTGVRVYATHGNISWSLWYIKEDEVSDNSDATSGRDGDQDYYMARVDFDFGSFQFSPAVGYVRNRNTTTDNRFATGLASVDAFGSGCHNFRTAGTENSVNCASNTSTGVAVDENVIYPGLIAKGNFGPVSFVGEVFGAFGEIGDDSAVDAQRNQDVSAFLVAVDVGVKLGAWTPHAGIIYASGDDNPHDDDAEAWAPIESDNDNLLGMRGVIMDDDVDVLGISDDAITSENIAPASRQYFTQPGLIALFVGLKGRPTKKIVTDLNVVYFQWDTEKQWEYVNGVVSTAACAPTQTLSQQGVCSNSNFTNGVADGNGLISSVDDEIGWELNGAVTYSYNKHVTFTISAAVFWPGDGAEVVAQCANNAGGGWFLGGQAQNGCVDPGGTVNGRNIETVGAIGRADDEAFNVEAELSVEF